MTASDRLRAFVDARTGMQGLDPDLVVAVVRDEIVPLRLSDLREVLDDLDAYRDHFTY